MSQTQNNNKRIAKNTLLLYLRMIFLLSISLFTSRVVLQTLGVEDYGIYNVVGGVVALFAFLNGAMTGATQRYLNFDLAKNDTKALSETFSTALIIHSLIALTLILLSETVGLWFMYEKMVIPEERMTAAMWVLQCAILVMSVNIISVPYNAAIIAHEKMGAFAYISLLEATLKLLIVYMLYISPVDKLILYAILLLTVSVVIRFVYSSYSHKHFKETHFRFIWNTVKLKEMGAFASWNLIGNLALMGVTQGLNMLLNVFFGPVVNAARGVAVQVQGAIQQFANNFQTAINPQITKSYASNHLEYMHSLICRGAKFSFFMVLFMSLPFLIMTDQALALWLKTPPAYTSTFLRIILLNVMIDCLSNPLNNAVNASGKIRTFQLTNGVLMLSVVPLAYVALRMYANPSLAFFTQLVITGIAHFIKLSFTKERTGLPLSYYARKVYLPVTTVGILSPIIPYSLYNSHGTKDLLSFFITGFLCLVSVALTAYIFGLSKNERAVINTKLIAITNKIKR